MSAYCMGHPETGTYFQREWFERYDHRSENLNVYVTTDFAVTDASGVQAQEMALAPGSEVL